jgi:hypothetical protein
MNPNYQRMKSNKNNFSGRTCQHESVVLPTSPGRSFQGRRGREHAKEHQPRRDLRGSQLQHHTRRSLRSLHGKVALAISS